MTELDLYKFIKENNIEWHRHSNEGDPDVIIMPLFADISRFKQLFSGVLLDEDGIECRLRDGYFCVWMNDICEYYGIDINKVFIGENWDSD